jgi:hypothetical protein
MKFLRNLVFGKSRDAEQAPAPIRTNQQVDALERVRRPAGDEATPVAPQPKRATGDKSTTDILRAVASKAGDGTAKGSAGPGIWDMDDSIPSAEELLKRASAAPAKGKGRRVKTRLVGFDTSDGGVVDLFKDDKAKDDKAKGGSATDAETPSVEEEANSAPDAIPMFPVGWILVVEGAGRGASFPLMSGMSNIGRGADQAVRLDFGDNAISRSAHAAIVYDDEAKTFLLGQGGKSNIVRLNGTPVIQNEDLKDGDQIKVGETVLQLKTLCGEDFDWKIEDEGEDEEDDVAIA